MLGLGETREELLNVLAELLDAGCDFLTLGQYLMPAEKSADHYLPVERFVPPEEFAELGRLSKSLGFKQVASGPYVRSSYHAREMAITVPDFELPGVELKLTAWLASTGDRVVEGDRIVEVLAGPATVDLDSPATGILVEKLVAVEEEVVVGQVIGVVMSRE
jgi:hypothetical protein